jgi:hypothetical protein
LNLVSLGPSSPSAEISGVPVETGTDKIVTISVRDSLGLEAKRDYTLNIFQSTIEILAPAGGEHLLSGSTYEIRWRVQGYAGETFKIEMNLDGSTRDFPEVIAESAPAGSGFAWAVPASTSGTCRMRIKSNEFPSLSATMERTFTLAVPGVQCLYPNGSELLETETVRTLRWRSLGNLAGKVRIDFNTDGSFDSFPHVIEEEAPDTGGYSWNVPRTISETCRVRVQFLDAPDMQDASDGPFSIRYRSRARGLIWIPHTGFEEMEVRGAVAAITLHETDFHWSLSKAMKPEQLQSELHGKETFIMVEQKSVEANFKALGRSLGPVLEEFVTDGGTVVVLKQAGASRDFLPATKLLDVTEAGKAFDVPCRVVWPDHPVVISVPTDFSAGTATAWYRIPEGGVDVYATTADGMPVIMGRDIGDGRVVLIGFDYRDYNPQSSRVLANAVRNTPFTQRPHFVRGDANSSGSVDIGDAIFILNFLFKGGPQPACLDAADVDDSAQVAGAFTPVDLTDALLLVRWLFFGGEPPAPPSPLRIRGLAEFCGVDPQLRDDLDCGAYPFCE